MSTQYICQNDNRHQAVAGSTTLNGIDFIEVASADQTTLAVHFHHPLPGQTGGVPTAPTLKKDNVIILGGTRVRDIRVEQVTANDHVLKVEVSERGDFSFYTLQIVKSAQDRTAPIGFDPLLAEVEFSFKAGCPSEFDCQQVRECPPEKRVEPAIDYLAKDYASFRRLMLDRLSLLASDWQERNPADAHVALVELLAYVGDHLSYYQDAVATEAYLGTARKRISVRRHARLLDYFMHEGCNARAWLCLKTPADLERTNAKDPLPVPADAQFVTAAGERGPVFEPMHPVHGLYAAHNEISFYTWGNEQCCLPKGATRATLSEPDTGRLCLRVGDALIFEEVVGPKTGKSADADPLRRHAVRLVRVSPEAVETITGGVIKRTPAPAVLDGLYNKAIVEVEWAEAEALPFPLCLSALVSDGGDKPVLKEISIARGNVVLADHGETRKEPLADALRLEMAPLTHQGRARDAFGQQVLDRNQRPLTFDPSASASAALRWEMRDTLPAIELTDGNGERWFPLADLLNADRFTPAFVAEIDEAGRAELRFGDGNLGRQPAGEFTARYRVGNGRAGNVGAETIVRSITAIAGVKSVRNPLPAQGGRDPEPLEEVRQFAPQAFRVRERAVTEADWAEVAQRHPEVQKAAAQFRWTGSWTTVFVTIDRKGGKRVDADFEMKLRAHLERYRIAGYDLEVDGPVLVPLDLLMCVCVKPGYFQSEVKKGLLAAFSNRDLPDGRRGFFHPDNFTFGQAVFLSQLYRIAMQQPGVASVEVKRFQRWGKLTNKEIENGLLKPATLEILQLDNDRNFPENGKLEFDLHGGL